MGDPRREGEEGKRHTGRVDDQHLGPGRDGALELVKVNLPLARRQRLGAALLGRVHGHVDDFAAGHLDVADVLVEEGLKDNDLVARLDEGHEGAEHAWASQHGSVRTPRGDIPSLAPVVMVISVSGFSLRPHDGA